ncbi:LysR family transcriptional regulator [Kitasatospora sp. MMS16-BH015]|nr:LysR family transcriptional regulator [Kitasatospora sp. MMS16-BH015]
MDPAYPGVVETRELRYFVAVAEELHFGRAALRLGIAQPPLSRAIRQLERRLGATLLDRTSRSVRLTEAGAVLLTEGRAALDAVEAAERRTRRAALAASGRPGLTLVTKASASRALLADLLAAYAAAPGAVPVEVILCGPGEQGRLLREGRADVALLHRPFDSTAGLDCEALASEGQVAVLPAGHPLAARAALRLAELTDLPGLPLPRWPRPDGSHPPGPGPQVRDQTQLLQLVSLGRACAVFPESCRAQLPADLAAVPVPDAPTVTTVIAWPPHSRAKAVADLVRTATALRPGSHPEPRPEPHPAGHPEPRPELHPAGHSAGHPEWRPAEQLTDR